MTSIVNGRLHFPCTVQICSPSFGGKSVLAAKIIKEKDRLFTAPISHIIYLYSSYQPLYDRIKEEEGDKISFVTSVEQVEEVLSKVNHSNTLLIGDDQLLSLKKDSRFWEDLYSRRSHHENISVIFISQAIFSPQLRFLNLNTHYFIIFKFFRDSSMLLRLGAQIDPLDSKFIYKAYLDSTSVPYGYLVVSAHPFDPFDFRFRNTLFYWEEGFSSYVNGAYT